MSRGQDRYNPGIGCIHGNRITECEHCAAEDAELQAWEHESDQLLEAVRLGEAALDDTLDWLAYIEREAA